MLSPACEIDCKHAPEAGNLKYNFQVNSQFRDRGAGSNLWAEYISRAPMGLGNGPVTGFYKWTVCPSDAQASLSRMFPRWRWEIGTLKPPFSHLGCARYDHNLAKTDGHTGKLSEWSTPTKRYCEPRRKKTVRLHIVNFGSGGVCA